MVFSKYFLCNAPRVRPTQSSRKSLDVLRPNVLRDSAIIVKHAGMPPVDAVRTSCA